MIRRLIRLIPLVLGLFALTGAYAGKTFTATSLMAEETRTMVRLLENFHFRGRELSPEDFRKLVPDYMGELDAHHLFFLAADQDKLLEKYADRLPNALRYLGNLDAAFEMFNLFRDRSATRVAWIQAELKQDFDFSVNEEFAWDRSKAPWPATIQEADELWHKRIKFELLQDLLNKKSIETAKENVRKRYERMLRNLDEVDAEEVQETYLTTLTRMYDPHTEYMSPSTLEDFSMQMRLSLVGIGAQLSEDDGVCVIRELIPGGPADLSKLLRPKDKIVAVAQASGEPVDVVGMKLRKVVELIRGDKGTKVRLTVQPADATDPAARREVTLVRDLVKLNASRAHASIHEVPAPDGTILKLGVIVLPAFYGMSDDDAPDSQQISATRDTEQLVRKLVAAGVSGMILDLRNNGGGLLSEAVDLSGLFIAKGPVVQVKSSAGRVEVKSDDGAPPVYTGPLAVLTSRFSASASEIVAGALQNYGRAVVIGDSSTHGKGTVQAVFEMNGSSVFRRSFLSPEKSGAAKMTVQKFYLPNGASTQNRGVLPDIVLPSIEDFMPIGESDLPNALAWDTIPTTKFDGAPLDVRFLVALRERDQSRQALTPEFAYLRKNIDWFKERERKKTISLNLEERRQQKVADDAWNDAMKKERAELAKLNFPNQEIQLDGVEPTKAHEDLDGDDNPDREDENARIDIHLRDGLRVLADAIDLWHKPTLWRSDSRPLTASNSNRFAPVP